MNSSVKIISLLIVLGLISASIFFCYHSVKIVGVDGLDCSDDPVAHARLVNILSDRGMRVLSKEPPLFDKLLTPFYRKCIIQPFLTTKLENRHNIVRGEIWTVIADSVTTPLRFNREERDDLLQKLTDNKPVDVILTASEKNRPGQRLVVRSEDGMPVMVTRCWEVNLLWPSGRELAFDFDNDYDGVEYDILPSTDILGFAGDVVIEEYVKYSLKHHGVDYSFKKVLPLLETADIMSCNLEFVVSRRGKGEPKRFTFKASEKQFELIASSPFDYVTTANNHAMDYGPNSLLDTIKILDKYEVAYSGSGANIDAAFKPAKLSTASHNLDYIAICGVTNEASGYKTMAMLRATETSPGVAWYDTKRIRQLISESREAGRIPIIQFHTGLEYEEKPRSWLVKRMHRLIDWGAEAVICHHSHVVSGVEIYKGRVIAYSLGDFLFDVQKPHADEGIILYLYLQNGKVSGWSAYPTVCHWGAVVQKKQRLAGIEQRFLQMSAELSNSNQPKL